MPAERSNVLEAIADYSPGPELHLADWELLP